LWTYFTDIGFMAFTASVIQMTASWIIITFRIVSLFRRFGGKLMDPKRAVCYLDVLTSNSYFLLSQYKPPLPSSMSVKLTGHNPCNFHTRTSPSHSAQCKRVTVISNPRHPPNKIFQTKIYYDLYQKYPTWYNRFRALRREQVSGRAKKSPFML